MKKLLLLFILFALQGCLEGIYLLGAASNLNRISRSDNDKPKSKPYKKREPKWGLELQIGDYVIDSIFPSPLREVDTVSINFDKIAEIPNYKEASYTGKIYNWDAKCARTISFLPVGSIPAQSVKLIVSPSGNFNFSKVFDRYPIFDEYPGSGSFYISPDFVDNDVERLYCYNGYGDILVHFSL